MRQLLVASVALLALSCAPDVGDDARRAEHPGLDPQLQADRTAKIPVCHYSADDDSFVHIEVAVVSAHTDVDKHDLDVKPGRWHVDQDGDGQGARGTPYQVCPGSLEGWAAGARDCDDDDAGTYSGAPELCDGVDNDCNGRIDEGC